MPFVISDEMHARLWQLLLDGTREEKIPIEEFEKDCIEVQNAASLGEVANRATVVWYVEVKEEPADDEG